jgi:hypothetical protein
MGRRTQIQKQVGYLVLEEKKDTIDSQMLGSIFHFVDIFKITYLGNVHFPNAGKMRS